MKVRDTILSFAFCLFILGPCCLWATQSLFPTLHLPSWLTAEDAIYLVGGISETDINEHLSLKGFEKEALQSSLETEINNHIPLRADSLLLNASMQRVAIASSNALFGFDAYPTFFSSDTAYYPAANALVDFPRTNGSLLDRAAFTASGIADLAKKHPDKNFYLVVSDISDTAASNPLGSLISGEAILTKDFIDTMEDSLGNADNVHITSVIYNEPDEYYQNYYTTDHHWNGFGTLDAYRALAPVASLDQSVSNCNQNLSFTDFPINGTYAREGLMLLNESALEPKFDLSDLEVAESDTPPIASRNSVQTLEALGPKASYGFYPEWYGTTGQAVKSPIVNNSNPLGKKAAVIMDSYGDSLRWLLARNYGSVRCYRDIRGGERGEATLEERISESGAQDIYFVGSALAYTRIPSNFPNYFS